MSKQVSDRIRSTRTTTTVVRDTAEPTGQGIEMALAIPSFEGKAYCLALVRLLNEASDDMVRKDQAHEQELGDDGGPRAARDAAFQTMRGGLMSLRGLVSGTHGEEALARLGLSEPCPYDPSNGYAYGLIVEKALADSAVVLPPGVPGGAFDRAYWSTTVSGQVGALGTELASVKSQEVRAKVSGAARNEAIAVYDERPRLVVDTMTAWWRYLGKHELVEKLESDLRARESGEPEAPEAPTEVVAAPTPATPAE